jgi:hypothetical protein
MMNVTKMDGNSHSWDAVVMTSMISVPNAKQIQLDYAVLLVNANNPTSESYLLRIMDRMMMV